MPSSISSSEHTAAVAAPGGLTVLARGFVLTLLLLIAATELLVRTQVLPQDTRAGHLELLRTSDHADAAFGDSHVARGFAAQGSFVNLAYPSENIEDMFAKVRLHFAHHAPGRVIIQADPHLFAAYRVYAPARSNSPAHAPLLHMTADRHRPQLNAYWQAFVEGIGTLHSKVQQTANGALLSEGDFADLPDRMQTFEARMRLQNHALAHPDAVAATQDRYLDMITFLTERGADLCMISFPVTQDYLTASSADTAAGHATAISFFRQTAAQSGARFIDARAQVVPDRLFRDVDHMNAAGAKAVYDSLIRQCFDR